MDDTKKLKELLEKIKRGDDFDEPFHGNVKPEVAEEARFRAIQVLKEYPEIIAIGFDSTKKGDEAEADLRIVSKRPVVALKLMLESWHRYAKTVIKNTCGCKDPRCEVSARLDILDKELTKALITADQKCEEAGLNDLQEKKESEIVGTLLETLKDKLKEMGISEDKMRITGEVVSKEKFDDISSKIEIKNRKESIKKYQYKNFGKSKAIKLNKITKS